jgi:hypothetical protein
MLQAYRLEGYDIEAILDTESNVIYLSGRIVEEFLGLQDSGDTLAMESAGRKIDSVERNKAIQLRLEPKVTQLSLTDRVQLEGHKSEDTNVYRRITMKCYHLLGLYELYAEWNASGSQKPFRDTLSQLDLLRLERLEDWIVRKYSQGYQLDTAVSMY